MIVCGLFAYHAFYPDGIPAELKESHDKREESDEEPVIEPVIVEAPKEASPEVKT